MISAFLTLALQAAAPAPACTAAVAPPAGLEAWTAVAAAAPGPIAVGHVTALMLRPVDQLALSPAPGRAPKPNTFGGIYQVAITTAGTYRIALDAGAWIDLVRAGKMVESVAHTEGVPCSGIRKIVAFTLAPGLYTIQLSGAKQAPMRMLVASK